MKKTITIISNPVAGRKSKPFLDEVVKALALKGAEPELIFTEYAGHATLLARVCADEGKTSLVIASGGDGTIREVAEGLMDKEMPIGIIPSGTANVLARELGYMSMGRKTVERTASILMGDIVKPLYPFRVTLPDRKTLGLCWVGAGFDGDVLRNLNPKLKAALGRPAFVPAILKTLWQEKKVPSIPWSYGVSLHSLADEGLCGWALASNIERYAGPFRITSKTSVIENGLSVLRFEQAGMMARALDQLYIAFTTLDERGGSQRIKEGLLTLGDSKAAIQLDGDYAGMGPVTIEPLKTPLLFKAG